MKRKLPITLVAITLAFLAGAETALLAGDALPLRGFGAVAVSERAHISGQQSWVTFAAQDEQHAGVIGSKFVADLIGFGDLKIRPDSTLPGTLVTLEGSGVWLIALDGAKCQVLFARTTQGLSEMLSLEQTRRWKPITPLAYPRWLDCFDNAATGVWWGRGGGEGAQNIPADMEWATKMNFTLAHHGPENNRYVLPGVVDYSQSDWFAAVMKKYDRPYRIYLWNRISSAGWNYDPLPWVTPGTLKVVHPDIRWQQGLVTGQFVPAGGTETPAITNRYLGDYRRRFAEHYKDDPNYVGGAQAVSENNGANVLHLATIAGMPEFNELWHEYLKTTLGFDLQKVGQLHKGNKDFYRSWNDVKIPEPQDFLGYNPSCVNLVGTWEGHADRKKVGADAHWYLPSEAPRDGWQPVNCNDPLLAMYDGADNRRRTKREHIPDYWLRKTITLTAKQAESLKYLHISRNISYVASPATPLFDVYINGTELKKVDAGNFEDRFSQCLDAGSTLKAGENQVVINTLGCPVPGYLFLGTMPMRLYPEMSEAENRLWYDAVQFDTWLRLRAYKQTLSAFRSADPNRPFKLSTTADYLDEIIPFCEQYGAYPHNSGGAGAFWNPTYGARQGSVHGIPYSCEQGGPPGTPAEMQASMTYYLMYGNHAIDLVFSVAAYRTKPDIAAWVEQNISLMHCVGKLDLPQPPIGLLRSCRAERLGVSAANQWDLGRGAIQAIGRNYEVIDLPDIANGLINRFQIIIDDASSLLTPDEVAGIEQYVKNGGIFVALQNTGMHTPERGFSWPISSLTGLKVADHAITSGTIKFRDDQSLWPTLRGAESNGMGAVIDFMSNNQTGTSIGMEAEDKDVEVIAEWKDVPAGQGKVAIARRILGKGQVVVLGSSFWRDSQDLFGKYKDSERSLAILDELLNSLKIPRDSRTSDPDVWAERWSSKNGVYDLFAAARMVRKGEEKGNPKVTVRQPTEVSEVVELSANGHPRFPVKCQDGFVNLPETAFSPMQYHLYGTPRPDLENAVTRWFDVQRRLWRGLPPIPPEAIPKFVEQPKNVLPLVDEWKMSTEQPKPDWMQTEQSHPEWKPVKLGSFAAIGLPEEATARFFKKIIIPSGWRGQRVRLVLDSQSPSGIFQKAKLWINGREMAIKPEEFRSFVLDVSEQSATGILTLALEIIGDRSESQKNMAPSGVTGIFYLQSLARPTQMTSLSGPWFAADEDKFLTPVQPSKPGKYTYLETRFTLPKNWPTKRLYLQSPDAHLGWIVLNDQVLGTPAFMRELDISGLVRKDGENILRWLPNSLRPPGHTQTSDKPIPELQLTWLP